MNKHSHHLFYTKQLKMVVYEQDKVKQTIPTIELVSSVLCVLFCF